MKPGLSVPQLPRGRRVPSPAAPPRVPAEACGTERKRTAGRGRLAVRVAARAGAAPEGGSPEPPPQPAAVSSGLGVAGCRPRGPPPTHRELPGLPPKVAAVVAAPAEARSPGRGNLAASERTTTGGGRGSWIPRFP